MGKYRNNDSRLFKISEAISSTANGFTCMVHLLKENHHLQNSDFLFPLREMILAATSDQDRKQRQFKFHIVMTHSPAAAVLQRRSAENLSKSVMYTLKYS